MFTNETNSRRQTTRRDKKMIQSRILRCTECKAPISKDEIPHLYTEEHTHKEKLACPNCWYSWIKPNKKTKELK